jgi:hypothetical protein
MGRAEEQRRGSSLCCNLNYLLAIVLPKICCPVIRRERERCFSLLWLQIAAGVQ